MGGLLSQFFSLLIKLLLAVFFYGTPLLGFWLASSLTAFLGGPHYLAWSAGLLLFPVIPGLWELYTWSHRRKDSKPWFTPLDRVSMKTFAVGLAFLALLLYLYPQAAFVSLSTRGDWMLDGVKGARADSARRVLFRAASAVEWLYRASRNNPYKAYIDKKARKLAEEATQQREKELAQQREKELAQQREKELAQQREKELAQQREKESTQQGEKESTQQGEKESTQQGEKESTQQGEKESTQQGEKESTQQGEKESTQQAEKENKPELKWPWKGLTLHPAVSSMPASAETSISSVAHYIAKHETNPVLRIKALHDYVADRIAYDYKALYSGNIPSQDAESTFRTRKSVCAGYANLLSALAAAIKEQIIVVSGDARDPKNGDKLTGMGHAWNAAHIGKGWYLIDACWDAGCVSREKGFEKCYKTDYLMPPPEVIIQDHFPEEPTWQLLSQPLSQGEFLRQPMLEPGFQAAGLKLVSPRRARVESGPTATVILKNPNKQWLMAGLESDGKGIGFSSDPTNNETAVLERTLPDKGTYRLNMFINKKGRYGDYGFVGSVDFVNR
jgi:hypothetical protein